MNTQARLAAIRERLETRKDSYINGVNFRGYAPDYIEYLLGIAEVAEKMRDTLSFYRGAWNMEPNDDLEWSPKEELLEDCGTRAQACLSAYDAAAKGKTDAS